MADARPGPVRLNVTADVREEPAESAAVYPDAGWRRYR
jgi:hypothetical protein